MNIEFERVVDLIKSGDLPKTAEIGHVSYYMLDKTAYSFHFYAVFMTPKATKEHVAEFLYDLRNKKFFMKKNGSEVKFNVANLDTIIPRTKGGCGYTSGFYSLKAVEAFFEMVEVPENKGMYAAMRNAVGAIGDEKVDMTSRALIRLITDYNKLELMYKAGINIGHMYDNTFRGMVYKASKEDVRKIHQIFGVSKAQFKFLCEFTKDDHKKIAGLASHAQLLQPGDMDKYRAYQQLIMELEDKYNIDGRLNMFNGRQTLTTYVDAVFRQRYIREGEPYGGWNDNEFFGFIYQFKHSNPAKLIEYLLFECYFNQGIDQFNVAFSEYKDYYSMCQDLEYERFDKYPKYLKTQHDIVSRNYKAVSDEMTIKKFSEVTAHYKDYEATFGDFAIVVPDTPHDLVYEGNILQHCVASYVKKVADKRSLVVFLRDKEAKDEPLVTVEIRGEEIVQVRGQGNRSPLNEEKESIRRFAKRNKLKVKSFV